MNTKNSVIPKTLAAAADLYYQIREKRLELERQAAAEKDFETELKEHLIASLTKDTTGVAGKLCRVSAQNKVVPQVKDWELFYAYVAKNRSKGGFAMLNKAVNAKAVSEVWSAGKAVPGVEPFTTVVLSVNKL